MKEKKGPGEHTRTVWLIDWEKLEVNDFAIVENFSIKGELKKRPDEVFYVNSIALSVLELEHSNTSVSEGIRQNLDNQSKEFILNFFATM